MFSEDIKHAGERVAISQEFTSPFASQLRMSLHFRVVGTSVGRGVRQGRRREHKPLPSAPVEWRHSKFFLYLFQCLWMFWPNSFLPCFWILRWDILFLSFLQMVLLLLLLLAFGSTGDRTQGFSHAGHVGLYPQAIGLTLRIICVT